MGKFLEALCQELILFVKQSAWLDAVPDKAEGDKSKQRQKSRREKMDDDGTEPELPFASASYLAGYLFEVGPLAPAGMGSGAISHSEIASWQLNTGIELNAWESRTLKQLSIAYSNQSGLSTDRNCFSPLQELSKEKRRDVVSNQIASFMGNNVRKG
jgi:hypothetical protein